PRRFATGPSRWAGPGSRQAKRERSSSSARLRGSRTLRPTSRPRRGLGVGASRLAAEVGFEVVLPLEVSVAYAAFQGVDAGHVQHFAPGQPAGRLLGTAAAEPVRQALGTAEGVGLQFLRDAVAPAGGDLVGGGPAAVFAVTEDGVRRHGHGGTFGGGWPLQSEGNGTSSPLISARAFMAAFCSASFLFRPQ